MKKFDKLPEFKQSVAALAFGATAIFWPADSLAQAKAITCTGKTQGFVIEWDESNPRIVTSNGKKFIHDADEDGARQYVNMRPDRIMFGIDAGGNMSRARQTVIDRTSGEGYYVVGMGIETNLICKPGNNTKF